MRKFTLFLFSLVAVVSSVFAADPPEGAITTVEGLTMSTADSKTYYIIENYRGFSTTSNDPVAIGSRGCLSAEISGISLNASRGASSTVTPLDFWYVESATDGAVHIINALSGQALTTSNVDGKFVIGEGNTDWWLNNSASSNYPGVTISKSSTASGSVSLDYSKTGLAFWNNASNNENGNTWYFVPVTEDEMNASVTNWTVSDPFSSLATDFPIFFTAESAQTLNTNFNDATTFAGKHDAWVAALNALANGAQGMKGRYFTFKSRKSGDNYLVWNADNRLDVTSDLKFAEVWQIVGKEGTDGLYLYNPYKGLYLGGTLPAVNNRYYSSDNISEALPIFFETATGDGVPANTFYIGTTPNSDGKQFLHDGSGAHVVPWNNSGANSQWTIAEVTTTANVDAFVTARNNALNLSAVNASLTSAPLLPSVAGTNTSEILAAYWAINPEPSTFATSDNTSLFTADNDFNATIATSIWNNAKADAQNILAFTADGITAFTTASKTTCANTINAAIPQTTPSITELANALATLNTAVQNGFNALVLEDGAWINFTQVQTSNNTQTAYMMQANDAGTGLNYGTYTTAAIKNFFQIVKVTDNTFKLRMANGKYAGPIPAGQGVAVPLGEESAAGVFELKVFAGNEAGVGIYCGTNTGHGGYMHANSVICQWANPYNSPNSGWSLHSATPDQATLLNKYSAAVENVAGLKNVTTLFTEENANTAATALAAIANPLDADGITAATTAIDNAVNTFISSINNGPIILQNGDVYLVASRDNGEAWSPQRSTTLSPSNVFSLVPNTNGTVKLMFLNPKYPDNTKNYLGPAGAGSNTTGADLVLGYATTTVNDSVVSGLTITLPSGNGFLCSNAHASGNTHGDNTAENLRYCIWDVQTVVLPTGISTLTATPNTLTAAQTDRNVVLEATLTHDGDAAITPAAFAALTYSAVIEGTAVDASLITTEEGVTKFAVPVNTSADNREYTIQATDILGHTYTGEAVKVTVTGVPTLTAAWGEIPALQVDFTTDWSVPVTLTQSNIADYNVENVKATFTNAEGTEAEGMSATFDGTTMTITGAVPGTWTVSAAYVTGEGETAQTVATAEATATIVITPAMEVSAEFTAPTEGEYTIGQTEAAPTLTATITVENGNTGYSNDNIGVKVTAQTADGEEAATVPSFTKAVTGDASPYTLTLTLDTGNLTDANVGAFEIALTYPTEDDVITTTAATYEIKPTPAFTADFAAGTAKTFHTGSAISFTVDVEPVNLPAGGTYTASLVGTADDATPIELTVATDGNTLTITHAGIATPGIYTLKVKYGDITGTSEAPLTITVSDKILEVTAITPATDNVSEITLGNQGQNDEYEAATATLTYEITLGEDSAELTEDQVTVTVADNKLTVDSKTLTAATEAGKYTLAVTLEATAEAENVTVTIAAGTESAVSTISVKTPDVNVKSIAAQPIAAVTLAEDATTVEGTAEFTVTTTNPSSIPAVTADNITATNDIQIGTISNEYQDGDATVTVRRVTVAYTAPAGKGTITLTIGSESAEAEITVNAALPADKADITVTDTDDNPAETTDGATVEVKPAAEGEAQEVDITFTIPETPEGEDTPEMSVALPIAEPVENVDYNDYFTVESTNTTVAEGDIVGNKVKVTLAENAPAGATATLYVVPATTAEVNALLLNAVNLLADDENVETEVTTVPDNALIIINVTTKEAPAVESIALEASTTSPKAGKDFTVTATAEPADAEIEIEWTVKKGDEACTEGTEYTISGTNPATFNIKESGDYTITATVVGTEVAETIEIKVASNIITGEPGSSGIEAINADAAEGRAAIYDLSGRRLRQINAAGIYIINGVKTMVK